jgi:hypothetical protein
MPLGFASQPADRHCSRMFRQLLKDRPVWRHNNPPQNNPGLSGHEVAAPKYSFRPDECDEVDDDAQVRELKPATRWARPVSRQTWTEHSTRFDPLAMCHPPLVSN